MEAHVLVSMPTRAPAARARPSQTCQFKKTETPACFRKTGDVLTCVALRRSHNFLLQIGVTSFFMVTGLSFLTVSIWVLDGWLVLLPLLVLLVHATLLLGLGKFPYPFRPTGWAAMFVSYYDEASDQFRADMTHFITSALILSTFFFVGVLFRASVVSLGAFLFSTAGFFFLILSGYTYLFVFNYEEVDEDDDVEMGALY